ncbi:MAG: IPExxxVDY family protein [Bacteroidota bacterium]
MKKRRLDVDFAYDFELTGLISSARGYKLAWEINHVLGTDLVRKDDLKMTTREGEFFFTFFEHQSSLNTVKLFRNRASEGDQFLVPDHSHLDYILYTKGDEDVASKRLQEVLRNIPSIELVAFLPLAALKSKDNFIF